MLRTALLSLALVACGKSSEPSKTEPAKHQTAQPEHAAKPAPSAAKDPAAAKKLIGEGAVVIDVRTPDEFAEGHLPQATNIPVAELPQRLAEVDALVKGNKAQPVVVYCAAGARAGKAKQALDGAGYSQVVNGGGRDDLQ